MRIRNQLLVFTLIGIVAWAATQKRGVEPDPANPLVGMRVLIQEETSERSKLPPAQALIFTSADVRDYLNTHCGKERDGSAGWRIFDKDTPMEDETQAWRDAMAAAGKKRTSLPWLYITKGLRSYSDALPADTESTLKILKQYGG